MLQGVLGHLQSSRELVAHYFEPDMNIIAKHHLLDKGIKGIEGVSFHLRCQVLNP